MELQSGEVNGLRVSPSGIPPFEATETTTISQPRGLSSSETSGSVTGGQILIIEITAAVIGSLVVIAIIVWAVWFLRKRKLEKSDESKKPMSQIQYPDASMHDPSQAVYYAYPSQPGYVDEYGQNQYYGGEAYNYPNPNDTYNNAIPSSQVSQRTYSLPDQSISPESSSDFPARGSSLFD